MRDRTTRNAQDPRGDTFLHPHQKKTDPSAHNSPPHFHYSILTALLAAVCCALMLCGCGASSATPPLPSESSSSDKEYIEQLNLGDQALNNGDIEGALDAYFEAININSEVPQAYHRIFDTYVRDQRYDDALQFVRDNYRKIDTDAVRKSRTEEKEYVYALEGSLYDGMTSSEEEADLMTGFLDLETHYASHEGADFPSKDIAKLLAFIEEIHQEMGSSGLSDLYSRTVSLSGQYASILDSIKAAGFILPGKAWNRDPSDVLSAEETDSGSSGSLSLEMVQSFEAELRKLLEEDPDLIFIYLDIASLYIQAGDPEHAQEVYLEGARALQKMQESRGYVSLTAEPLFTQAMANVYHKSYNAASALVVHPVAGFRFYEEEPSGSDITPEQYQAEIDTIYQEAENISLPDQYREKLEVKYGDYSARVQSCFAAAVGSSASSTDTNVEGDAALIASTTGIYDPGSYNSDSGWLYLICGDGKGAGMPHVLVGTKTKSVLRGEECAEPVLCSDGEIIFEWRDCETGERKSVYYVFSNDLENEEQTTKADLYMVTYDLEGNKTGEEKILDFPGVDGSELLSLSERAMNSASSGHARISNYPWKRIDVSITEDSAVFQAAGITLTKPLREGSSDYMKYSSCFLNESDGLLVATWYSGGTEIYKLK